MAYNTYDPTDSLPVLEGKLDADAAKHDALQVATGIPEGTANLGAGSVAQVAGDPLAVDTAVERYIKNQGRIKVLEDAAPGVAANGDLEIDFDLTSITGAIKGSTSIEGAIASQYPNGVGLYIVEAVPSVAVAGTSFVDGDAIRITVSQRDAVGTAKQWFAASTIPGELPVWKEVGGPVTEDRIVDRNVTRIKLSADALAPTERTLSIPTSEAAAGNMTGGAFAAMPLQLGDRFVMSKTPFELFEEVGLAAGQRDYFVDGLLGDDANTGTAASSPKKTLEDAMRQPDLGTCWVAPGIYPYLDSWSGAVNSPSINQITLGLDDAYAVRRWDNGRPGDVIISTHVATSASYVAIGGTDNVWSMANIDCVNVVDPNHRTEKGAYVTYTQLTLGSDALNSAACDENPGTWYLPTAGGVALHKIGGGQPARNEILLCFDTDNVDEESRRTIYCERLNFVGGNDAMTVTTSPVGSTIAGKILMEGCNFYSSVQSGIKVTGFELAYLANCKAHGNGFDGIQSFGFDLSPSVGGDFITYNCEADDNGHGTPSESTNNINGYSNHFGVRGLHVRSKGDGNKGPQFADITDTQTWWVGCQAGFSTSISGGAPQSSFSVLGADAKGWAYRCEAPYYFASTGSFAGYDQCLFGSVDGDASTYTQA